MIFFVSVSAFGLLFALFFLALFDTDLQDHFDQYFSKFYDYHMNNAQ